jgi:hypothetical protein
MMSDQNGAESRERPWRAWTGGLIIENVALDADRRP